MGVIERGFELVTRHSRLAIAAMLVLTLVVGAGASAVEQSSSLDQFQSDTTESQKLDYIEGNFSTGPDNTTSVQIIVRDDNVLEKASLTELLEMQAELRASETVNTTLVRERPMFGVANLIASGGIKAEIGRELRATATEFERLNASVNAEKQAIREQKVELEQRNSTLNQTGFALREALQTIQASPEADVRAEFDAVNESSPITLDEEDFATFNQSVQLLETNQTEAYKLGTQGVLQDEYDQLRTEGKQFQDRVTALESNVSRLETLGSELKQLRAEMNDDSMPPLSEQRETLDSLNESQIDAIISQVLSDEGEDTNQALRFMPRGYQPGSASANATMWVITQKTDGPTEMGAAQESLTNSQLEIESIVRETATENDETIVFGMGKISDEINRSMADSLAIVGPLALLFVVIALVIAYRDLIDIVLGVLGIGAVLTITFGFMGWTGIKFNQMFVAVPVLLIGLSIDYAIHTFMRHREERHNEHTDSTVRGGMRVGLAGVGIALVWVTATTAIGFLANLTSPVPPIQEFGVVSAAGITAALLVFGILIPALKIELDEFFEGRGVDRKKTAFGTGGGRFSSALEAGEVMARKAPYVVILLAVLISVGGAYAGSQVDTSFNEEDFLADDPPDWTKDLPEPFKPGDYSAKSNLEYVNENFLREDSQAQILIEGPVATPEGMAALASARGNAGNESVAPSVQVLSPGNPDIESPLSVMKSVADDNESFNATYHESDTNGDGIPDRNIEGLYDELFATAPDEAASVIHKTDDGSYGAVRMVISIRGSASGDDVTSQMRTVAGGVEGEQFTATATGQTILFKIIQDQLLETVIDSLLITLVAVFAFLMVTYRITEGSATLGIVTLLPVVLSVTWILGTMYLLGIPFNILTGMITSLTVGLGVAYSIHLSERYNQELDRADDMWDAMQTAVTGTGGALLGSAATTVGGFGVLVFAILPPLQQFGIITGLTIIYAFLASVLVLPSLLVVWTKYLDPHHEVVEWHPGNGSTSSEE